jgi:hypothetical protein
MNDHRINWTDHSLQVPAHEAEKDLRIKYQDIVYAVCNFIDARLGSPARGAGVPADKDEIVKALGKVIQKYEVEGTHQAWRMAELYKDLDQLTVDLREEQARLDAMIFNGWYIFANNNGEGSETYEVCYWAAFDEPPIATAPDGRQAIDAARKLPKDGGECGECGGTGEIINDGPYSGL